MGKTITESLIEEGAVKGKRETLLRLKFKRISSAVTASIEAERDVQQIDRWLDAVLTAERISDIPFPTNK